jgi:hypothetical protein
MVMTARYGALRRVNVNHSQYDCMQYPMLFPRGDVGWSLNTSQQGGPISPRNPKCNLRDFLRHKLHDRAPPPVLNAALPLLDREPRPFNSILYGKRLL